MDVKGKKVFVGLSGGVDSAVSAALLQQAGAEVTGVYIKGWYPPGMPCTWAADRRDAMRVAARLHIPFITLGASREYKRGVIDYLLDEYRAGRTPNPDVMCNREVKFGVFYRYAKKSGADYIATGHYQSGEKDQRYFLWAVPKEILEETVFPVGDMMKAHVRTLARKFNLPVSEKRDSQGVCFLGNISVEEFLRNEFGTTPGQAIDPEGNAVGEHDGVLLHTLGERVALVDARESGPWFVLAKDIEKNILTVGKLRIPETSMMPGIIRFTDPNWHADAASVSAAQCRYRGSYVPGHIEGDKFVCEGQLPELPVPGQSIVFYAGDKLAGGAIIA